MSYAAPNIALRTPLVLSNVCRWCSYYGYHIGTTSGTPTTITGPAAFQAIYTPFVVTTPATFRRGFWYNGSAPDGTNNVSVAIYTPDGTRQATTGAVALSGASVVQSAAFAANYDATPGLYYMGIMYSVGSDANGIMGWGASLTPKMAGLYTQAVGSSPMPATATFAVWSSMVVPMYGITQTSFAI